MYITFLLKNTSFKRLRMEEIIIRDADIGVFRAYPIRFSHLKTQEEPFDCPYHLHDCLELYFYGEGDVDFFVGDQNYRLRHGDVIFTLPNELHRPFIRSATLYERFYVQIPIGAFDAFDALAASPLARFLQAPLGDRFIGTDAETRGELLHLLENISRHIREGNSGCLAYAELLKLLGLLDAGIIRAKSAAPVPPLIADVLRYVSEHALRLSSVREIADIFHVHPSYLSTAFSAAMNKGLKQYLIYKKISAAKEMLAAGETVTEVCYRTGFGSCSHFIDMFRGIVGVTPYRYQLAARQERQL